MKRSQRKMRLCVALLCVNLIFIWGNSMLPGEVSDALTQWVKGVLRMLFGGSVSGSSGTGLLRKLAHFTEFCTLGMLLKWLFAMVKGKTLLLPLAWGASAACIDEFIQLFVPGRHGAVTDVAIDTAGVCIGILLLTAGYNIYVKKKK